MRLLLLTTLLAFVFAPNVSAADLTIVSGGKTDAAVLVAADAGEWEKKAAEDLALYVEKMSGAKVAVISAADQVAARLAQDKPHLIVGKLALSTQPALQTKLASAAKKNPLLRADSIVVKREGNRVYLAGNNDDAHYYAMVTLLNQWGCRWYLPTEMGECIPERAELKVGDLDVGYGSPFEVRKYWISWNGSNDGKPEFMHRNFFNELGVPNGHNLAQFTKDLIPPGKSMFNVPIAEDKTADHVAKQVAPIYAAGKDVQLGMEDGLYESESPVDKELFALQYDKYFLKPSATDAFMTFYNKVAERLMKEHPNSTSRIGFLAYANITLPPVKVKKAAKPLVAYLAPIDIDPIHDMESPLSAPKREYKEMLFKWAEVMDGRVVIYDYDQGMMVWRDIPAPSVQMFRHDVKQYQKAGILGVDTESRGAFATTFTNLFYRGQLLWNPDTDVDAQEKQLYADMFGPAADPLRAYWQEIYKAWTDSIVTEHEYHVIPAVYSPAMVAKLEAHVTAAEQAMAALKGKANRSRNEELYVKRLQFMRQSFDILDAYTKMIQAANSEVDYAAAVKQGERGLAVREELTKLSDIFTTYKRIGENGAAWWPGEVEQYRKLVKLTNGEAGTLVLKTPLEWNFRTDPRDEGIKGGWATAAIAPSAAASKGPMTWQTVQKQQEQWQPLRTDVYLQAQGLITEDHQSYTGKGWYRTEITIPDNQAGQKLHLMFPGLFNECTLYVNGAEVAKRANYNPVWWYNAYEFEWDVDVAGKLKPGLNTIALRIDNPHHMGGMFRRPFVYAAK
jgi:hypothetical protein